VTAAAAVAGGRRLGRIRILRNFYDGSRMGRTRIVGALDDRLAKRRPAAVQQPGNLRSIVTDVAARLSVSSLVVRAAMVTYSRLDVYRCAA